MGPWAYGLKARDLWLEGLGPWAPGLEAWAHGPFVWPWAFGLGAAWALLHVYLSGVGPVGSSMRGSFCPTVGPTVRPPVQPTVRSSVRPRPSDSLTAERPTANICECMLVGKMTCE